MEGDNCADSMVHSQEDSSALERTPQILLQFPTLSVDGTPANWLSRSQLVAMASNPDYSASDDTASSLGDSAYDFVDDKSGIVSDDEEHDNLTHSVSSTEERELPQFDGQPHPIMAYHGGDNRSCASPVFSHSLTEAHSLSTGSGLTIRDHDGNPETSRGHFAPHMEGTDHTIVLPEPSAMSMDLAPFESEFTLKVFDQDEASEVIKRHVRVNTIPSTSLTAVVKQTMLTNWLIPPNPYKVLFVGDPSAREEIVWKIGSALDASSVAEYFPNQYAVVRIPSFEDATARGVELIDSTGISLIIEECSSAAFTKVEGGNDTISMTISNQVSSNQKLVESVWTGSGHMVTDDWSLPDIAVFYLSENDNISAKQTRHYARKFMSRHQVACIVISQAPLWTRPAEIIALDYTTLHICLKTTGSSTSIVKRLPVDLKTFMALDARQMNRNLAYLANRRMSSRRQASKRAISNHETSRDLYACEKGHDSSWSIAHMKHFLSSKYLPSLHRIILPCLLFILGLLLYQPIMTFAVGAPHVPVRQLRGNDILPNTPRACAGAGSTVPGSLQSKPPLITSSASSLIKKASGLKDGTPLASNSALASFLQGRQGLIPNKSESFQVGVIGDHHIVVRSPRWFVRSKKSHKLAFNVTRKGSPLRHQVSLPFDGVYALEIAKEDAYGTLNVSLWTTSKPAVNESFEVEFGKSWWNASAWNTATQVFSSAIDIHPEALLASIKGQYHRFATHLGDLVSWRSRTAHGAQQVAGKASKAPPVRASETTDILQSKIMHLPRNILLRLDERKREFSERMKIQAQQVRRATLDYSRNACFLVVEETRPISQAIVGEIQNIAQIMLRPPKAHLRWSKKKALKFWWKIGGLPRQRRVEGLDRGESQLRKGRSIKNTNR